MATLDTLYCKRHCLYEDTALQTAAYPSLDPLPLTTYLSATVIVLMMSSWADSWVWRREREREGGREREREMKNGKCDIYNKYMVTTNTLTHTPTHPGTAAQVNYP